MTKYSKTIYYKTVFGTYFVQTCRYICKYQFTMACITDLVIIAYQVINCLIFLTKSYVVGTQKKRRNETVLLSTIL